MNSIPICSANDFNSEARKVIKIQDHEILIILHNGEYHAMNNECPHAKGRLMEGRVENGTITCLNHGSCFDMKTGSLRIDMLDEDLLESIDIDNLPFGPLRIFPVRIEDNMIVIDFE